MYIIEMHHLKRAHAQIVLEKGDDKKPYAEFQIHRIVTNHAGDVDPAKCQWCAIRRRTELLRERRKANAMVSGVYSGDNKRPSTPNEK